MENNPEDINTKSRDIARLKEFKSFLRVVCSHMAMPLYFVFWFCDLIYAPQYKWEFLGLRTLIVPVSLSIMYLINKAGTCVAAERIAVTFSFFVAIFISVMTLMTKGGPSPYYAGLNLVAIGTLSFLPWSKRYYILTTIAIYGPWVAFSSFKINSTKDLKEFAVNGFFVVGTITISLIVRYFSEQLRKRELLVRKKLAEEVANRGKIIETKTEEALALEKLSSQFSPQVVSAINDKKIDLQKGIHRANICAIFIDIVNSTQRVTRIDEANVQKVIAMFMDDVIKTLLKYDITIDKFLGDGILAFCNDPVKYDDFADRVVSAAVEINDKIEQRQFLYENYWLSKLELRTGIASGYANIGFYGSDQYYHSYTAIGPVINLASRLCSAAEPNQILVSYDVLEKVNLDHIDFEFVGKKQLKGFEDDVIKVYNIKSGRPSQFGTDVIDCPNCQTIMHLDTNSSGIYVFSCRDCGYELDSLNTEEANKVGKNVA